jgi:hypothetical protein
VWYVNYNVSTCLSHEWKWFRDYETISPIKIYVQDNSTQEAIGRGNIKVLMSMGENNVDVVFINVLHVPRLAKTSFL